MTPNHDTHRNRPERSQRNGGDDTQKSRGGAAEKIKPVSSRERRQQVNVLNDTEQNTRTKCGNEEASSPATHLDHACAWCSGLLRPRNRRMHGSPLEKLPRLRC